MFLSDEATMHTVGELLPPFIDISPLCGCEIALQGNLIDKNHASEPIAKPK